MAYQNKMIKPNTSTKEIKMQVSSKTEINTHYQLLTHDPVNKMEADK